MMESDRTIREVARALIGQWASGAKRVASERAAAHAASEEAEGREFWTRVGESIDELAAEQASAASPPAIDGVPPPHVRRDGVFARLSAYLGKSNSR